MIWEDYEKQIKRLQTAWPSAYSIERIKLFFGTVKNLDARAFEYQVGRWLSDSRQAPLGQEFAEFARQQKRNTLTVVNGSKCNLCHGDGRILAKRKTANEWDSPFTFGCSYCDNFQKQGYSTRNFPMWNDSMMGEYEAI